MSSDVMIRATGLGKAFTLDASPLKQLLAQLMPAARASHEFWALKALDLTVQRGDVIGIIGQNGSGKSTLLQMLCGTLTPTCGEVQVNGRLAALLELGAGFNANFTGWENIRLSASLYGLSAEEVERKLPAIEAFADIGEFINKPVKTYSSGMFVRLAFAVIANIDADILVIDEALAVGDVFFTQKCMRFLKEFARRGTILFVSHDSTSVVSLCNKALLLDHGQLLAVGAPKTITEYYLKRQYDRRQAIDTGGVPVSSETKASQIAATASFEQNSFGLGGATVTHCIVTDEKGHPVLQVNGPTKLRLVIQVFANAAIAKPIVGFSVKDRLGQVLFGGNTENSLSSIDPLTAGQSVETTFDITVPGLALGDYMVSVAAGEGTATDHVMHHWIHDAYPFRSALPVQSGMIELPIEQVSFRTLN